MEVQVLSSAQIDLYRSKSHHYMMSKSTGLLLLLTFPAIILICILLNAVQPTPGSGGDVGAGYMVVFIFIFSQLLSGIIYFLHEKLTKVNKWLPTPTPMTIGCLFSLVASPYLYFMLSPSITNILVSPPFSNKMNFQLMSYTDDLKQGVIIDSHSYQKHDGETFSYDLTFLNNSDEAGHESFLTIDCIKSDGEVLEIERKKLITLTDTMNISGAKEYFSRNLDLKRDCATVKVEISDWEVGGNKSFTIRPKR